MENGIYFLKFEENNGYWRLDPHPPPYSLWGPQGACLLLQAGCWARQVSAAIHTETHTSPFNYLWRSRGSTLGATAVQLLSMSCSNCKTYIIQPSSDKTHFISKTQNILQKKSIHLLWFHGRRNGSTGTKWLFNSKPLIPPCVVISSEKKTFVLPLSSCPALPVLLPPMSPLFRRHHYPSAGDVKSVTETSEHTQWLRTALQSRGTSLLKFRLETKLSMLWVGDKAEKSKRKTCRQTDPMPRATYLYCGVILINKMVLNELYRQSTLPNTTCSHHHQLVFGHLPAYPSSGLPGAPPPARTNMVTILRKVTLKWAK